MLQKYLLGKSAGKDRVQASQGSRTRGDFLKDVWLCYWLPGFPCYLYFWLGVELSVALDQHLLSHLK